MKLVPQSLVPLSLALLTLSAGCNADLLVPGFADHNGATLDYDDQDAPTRLTAAAVAIEVSEEPEDNLLELEDQVVSLMDTNPELDLILFGETSLGLYYVREDSEEYQRSVAQPIPGPATERIGDLAADEGVNIAFGMAELDGEDLYNSLVLIGRDGAILATHRKIALIPWDVTSGYIPGEEVTTVDMDGVQIGFAICNDLASQPLVEGLAEADVDVIVHAWATNVGSGSDISALSRATGAWNVASNRYGPEGDLNYNGDIFIADPGGTRRIEQRDLAGHVLLDMGVY